MMKYAVHKPNLDCGIGFMEYKMRQHYTASQIAQEAAPQLSEMNIYPRKWNNSKIIGGVCEV